MKYRKTLTVGSRPDRPFKYIKIDYPFGNAILVSGVEVGGFLIRDEVWKGGVKTIFLEGIEIEPEHRGKGIARAVIKQLLERGDMVIGSITDDECKPFWKSIGAVMHLLPLETFGERYLPSITTKEPQFFYITKNPKAAELAEQMAKELPILMMREKDCI